MEQLDVEVVLAGRELATSAGLLRADPRPQANDLQSGRPDRPGTGMMDVRPGTGRLVLRNGIGVKLV